MTASKKRILVVANPAAGQDEPVLATLDAAFGRSVDWDLRVTHEAGDAERLASEAASAGATIVAAYGGDGTVSEVVSGLVGTRSLLGILPGGTANVLAVDLGIPLQLADAARLLVKGARRRKLDVGQAGTRHFVLRLAVGLEAEMDLQADRESKDRLGVLAYPVAAVAAARTAPVTRYELQLDGENVTAEGVDCTVANSGSLGVAGLGLAPDIDVSDGLLDVVVLAGTDAATLLSATAGVVTGRPVEGSGVQRWKAREVTVTAHPKQRVVADGEPAGSTPVSVRVLPAAVTVLVPRG